LVAARFGHGRQPGATWNLPIPIGTAFLGVRFHGQSLALDTLANAAGATVSDAAMVTIGL
jgi:hypothetical protein